ncbi:MAG: hypothetical protein FJZ61_03325 [Chlamydiae bacterium]|nr:hypothetical protein [Chlamydiota bacterium]
MTSIINSASSAAYAATSYLGTAIRNVGNLAGRIVTTLSNFVPSQVSTKVQGLFSPISRACSALPKPIKVAAIVAGGIASVVALKRFYNMKSTNQNNAQRTQNGSSGDAESTMVSNDEDQKSLKELPEAPVSGSGDKETSANQSDVLKNDGRDIQSHPQLDPVPEEGENRN